MGKRGPQPRTTERLITMVEPETLARLKAMAETRDLPVSVIVREAIMDYFSLWTGQDKLLFSNVVRRRNHQRNEPDQAATPPGPRLPPR